MAHATDNLTVTDPGPGVHVVVHRLPADIGQTVANAVGATLITSPAEAEEAILQRSRLPAARAAASRLESLEKRAAVSRGDAEHDQTLLARKGELERLAHRRILDDATADRLRELGRELTSLSAARERTEWNLHRSFAESLGIAAPPDPPVASITLAVAASAVIGGEEARADARQSLMLLSALDPLTSTGPESGPPSDTTPILPPESSLSDSYDISSPGEFQASQQPERSRHDGSVLMPLGLFLIGVFAASVVLLSGLPTIAAPIALAVAAALAAASRYSIRSESRRKAAPTGQAAASATSTEAEAGVEVHSTPTDEAVMETETASAMVHDPSNSAPPIHSGEEARRTVTVANAERRLASAQHTWTALAGPEADAHQLSSSTEPITPPFATAAMVATSPAVKALVSVQEAMRSEWNTTWSQLGRTAPLPDRALIEIVLDELRATAPDPREARELLIRLTAAAERENQRAALAVALHGDDLDDLRANAPSAEDLDDRPLVLVAPFTELDAQHRLTMRRRLDELDPDLTVVVVVETADDVPRVSEPIRV